MRPEQSSIERQVGTGQPKPSRDLPGWAQVFGSGFTVLTAAVTAATLGSAAVAVLVAFGTTAMCVALFTGLNQGPWNRTKKAIVTVASAATVGLAATATVVAAAGRSGSSANLLPAQGSNKDTSITKPEQAQKPRVAKTGYRLTASSDPLTNDEDKVDLDTGCPGWGPTNVRIGRDRCGDLADLILETQEVHTPSNVPQLALLEQGQKASSAVCRDPATTTAAVGAIQLADVTAGSELCVTTDKDNIAAVHVTSVGAHLVISFEVWRG